MCQNYGWSLDEAMSMTLPQIFMMNHAAWVNHERMDERIERDKNPGNVQVIRAVARDDNDPVLAQYGKRLSECTSEEIAAQFRGM